VDVSVLSICPVVRRLADLAAVVGTIRV